MRKILGIIFTIIGLLTIFLAVKGFTDSPEVGDTISSAVEIEANEINPDNEGKLVFLSGTLKVDKPLKDPLTGVELPGVSADRYVWVYERSEGKDSDGNYT